MVGLVSDPGFADSKESVNWEMMPVSGSEEVSQPRQNLSFAQVECPCLTGVRKGGRKIL